MGVEEHVEFIIEDLTLTYQEDYLGYEESKFNSPSLVQNVITSYNFENSSGWTATAQSAQSSKERPSVETAYGRFIKSNENLVWADSLTFYGTTSQSYVDTESIVVNDIKSGNSAGIILGWFSAGTYTLNLQNIGYNDANGVKTEYNSIRIITSEIPTDDKNYTENAVYESWGAKYYSSGDNNVRQLPYTFTIEKEARIGIVFITGVEENRGTTKQVIKNLKVERGKEATPWRISSHDLGLE
jgi:hypothetical protein